MIVLGASALLNALLLFLIQPLFGKMVLPVLGGSASVWTACMLFFQVALLAGYAYAHAGPTMLGVRGHAFVHGCVVWLPLTSLPIVLKLPTIPNGDAGAWFVFATTALSIGLPFVVLSAGAPLMQLWAASRRAAEPYSLYALSNTGSFAALLLYPLAVEPNLTLPTQSHAWAAAYVAVAIAISANAFWVAFRPTELLRSADREADEIPLFRLFYWAFLAAAQSSLLLGTTTSLTLDVAPIPLLWIVPLAIYLASFIIAFSSRAQAIVPRLRRFLPIVLLPEVLLFASGMDAPWAFRLILRLAVLATLGTLGHSILAADRPAASRLTQFYLWVSAGGAVGGIFNSLIAPRLFLDISEFPLAIACSVALLATPAEAQALLRQPPRWVGPLSVAAILGAGVSLARFMNWPSVGLTPLLVLAAVLCLRLSRDTARFAGSVTALLLTGMLVPADYSGNLLERSRTFFGAYRVVADGPGGGFHTLYHGTTMHGRERVGQKPPEPLAYYHRRSPVGELFEGLSSRIQKVGVIGLGVGALASYAQPGQNWTFYEIDPEVERIARNEEWFTYLAACGASCHVVQGDGRQTMARRDDRYDVLVLDAFSSDAVPMHLLTTEAIELYLDHLADDGVIAFHVSNKYLNLPVVVNRQATHLGMAVAGRVDVVADEASGNSTSVWVMMARRRKDLEPLASGSGWKWLTPDPTQPWSDDFSSLWGVARMWR